VKGVVSVIVLSTENKDKRHHDAFCCGGWYEDASARYSSSENYAERKGASRTKL